jgi:hypothetical protein
MCCSHFCWCCFIYYIFFYLRIVLFVYRDEKEQIIKKEKYFLKDYFLGCVKTEKNKNLRFTRRVIEAWMICHRPPPHQSVFAKLRLLQEAVTSTSPKTCFLNMKTGLQPVLVKAYSAVSFPVGKAANFSLAVLLYSS